MAFQAHALDQRTDNSANGYSHDLASTMALISDINNALNGNGTAAAGIPDGVTPNSGMEPEKVSTARLSELYASRTGDLQKLEGDYELLEEQYHNARVERENLLAKLESIEEEHSRKMVKQLNEYECRTRCLQDRIVAQEAQFHRLITEKEECFAAQMHKLVKSTEVAQREKDNAVVRYAQRERDILVLEAANQKAKHEINHLISDREALRGQIIAAKNDRDALVKTCNRKDSDLAWFKRELDRLKNALQDADVRMKAAYQKSGELEEANKALTAEISMLRSPVQLPLHGASEENSATTPGDELGKNIPACCNAVSELRELKKSLTAKDERVTELEKLIEEKSLNEVNLRSELANLRTELKEASANLISLEEAKRRISEAEADKAQAECEACQCRRETERLLQLVERLTENNTLLKTENLSVVSKLEAMDGAEKASAEVNKRTHLELKHLVKEVDEIRCSTQAEIGQFKITLDNLTRSERELSQCLADELSSNRVQRKKQAVCVKELKAEIAALRKRLEQHESSNASQSSGGSALEGHSRAPTPTPSVSVSRTCAIDATGECDDTSAKKAGCEHNQAMIEKIVKLQRAVARRNEKVELLEESVKHLAQECRKKTRIIQAYVSQAETGVVPSEYLDSKKAEIAKRGRTLMSNLFGSGMSNKEINLELALEMLRKFQLVLEDTLLKNLILKENVQTLGQEISRLSQENYELRLRLPDNEHATS